MCIPDIASCMLFSFIYCSNNYYCFCLIQVNGEDLSEVSRADALTILMKTGDVCAMVVLRQEMMMEAVSGLPPRRLSSVRRRKESASKSAKVSSTIITDDSISSNFIDAIVCVRWHIQYVSHPVSQMHCHLTCNV